MTSDEKKKSARKQAEERRAEEARRQELTVKVVRYRKSVDRLLAQMKDMCGQIQKSMDDFKGNQELTTCLLANQRCLIAAYNLLGKTRPEIYMVD